MSSHLTVPSDHVQLPCRLVQLQQTQQRELFPFPEHGAAASVQFVCVLPRFLECVAIKRLSLAPTKEGEGGDKENRLQYGRVRYSKVQHSKVKYIHVYKHRSSDMNAS